MREIKFRAWDKNGDGMFYNVEQGISFDDGSKYDFHQFIEPLSHDIHEWVLMQYTGLKDRNGKEIYDDDVIQDSSKNQWQVAWHIDHACFIVRSLRNRVVVEIIDNLNMSVIGNIHQNPELLTP